MPLDANDLITIQAAIDEGGSIWKNTILNDIKRKLKLHFLGKTTEQCCYCRKDFTDEFMLVMDIEHILPKVHYSNFMFSLFNLSVSCKRCNMRIKQDRVDFLVDHTSIHLNPEDTTQYHFIHPNLDTYFDNISYIAEFRNNKKLIKYDQLTPKGVFTYTYFELDKIEVDTINQAQGIAQAEIDLSSKIPQDMITETKALLDQL